MAELALSDPQPRLSRPAPRQPAIAETTLSHRTFCITISFRGNRPGAVAGAVLSVSQSLLKVKSPIALFCAEEDRTTGALPQNVAGTSGMRRQFQASRPCPCGALGRMKTASPGQRCRRKTIDISYFQVS